MGNREEGSRKSVPRPTPGVAAPPLTVRLLGALRVERGGNPVPLPPSRKVRALLGYLLLAPRPVPRERLCEVFWDIADDPRAELRWCLTKIRKLMDTPGRRHLVSDGDRMGIDSSGIDIDALKFANAINSALATGSIATLRSLIALIEGDLLEGLGVERSPLFDSWLATERARYARWHRAALNRIASLLPDHDEHLTETLRQCIALDPHDPDAHAALIGALRRRGQKSEADAARATAIRMLESHGVPPAALDKSEAGSEPRQAIAPLSLKLHGHDTGPRNAASLSRVEPIHRASIVVMPFEFAHSTDTEIAHGLTHDVTFGLAKLRSLKVIARGTAFALKGKSVGPAEAGALLAVDYVATGTVHREPGVLRVAIELAEAGSGRIRWADDLKIAASDILALLNPVTTRIVSALDAEVHAAERDRALLNPPESLDAWECYHRALWHMYRFTSEDNQEAQALFVRSTALDRTFSRAYAGLSFTHFQNAFLFTPRERHGEVQRAFDSAGEALMADRLDPAAHWAMGRALWLRGDDPGAFRALDEAVDLSPNFAMAHYARAFVHSQTGDPAIAVTAAETARDLSPYDPLLFGMYAAQAFGSLRLRRFEEAAQLARQVAEQPNAHAHAHALAALTLAAAGHIAEAKVTAEIVLRERPTYSLRQFLDAFRLADDLISEYVRAAEKIGLSER